MKHFFRADMENEIWSIYAVDNLLWFNCLKLCQKQIPLAVSTEGLDVN